MSSIYVHIPFCIRKCPYCAFYSVAYSHGDADSYLAALDREAGFYAEGWRGRSFGTIYIGGGTPTVLSPDQLSRLFTIIRKHFTVTDNVEITVEANPGSITEEKLGVLFASGVNRLSIGVQSFSDDMLRAIGRIHTALDAQRAVVEAREAGFKNIGIDLIYGIPGMSVSIWRDSLACAVSLGPEHISVYCLSLDEGTYFTAMAGAGMLSLPGEDLTSSQYELAVYMLSAAGYRRYEISNFSRPGFECRHNLNYWSRGEYLGLGAGAWSFTNSIRYMNIADLWRYCTTVLSGYRPVCFEERIEGEEAAEETIMLRLRTAEGLELSGLARAYGDRFLNRIMGRIPLLEQQDFISLSDGRMRLTDRGMLIADSVMERLF